MVPGSSLRILHGIGGMDAASGGPSFCLAELCSQLAADGADVTLAATVYGGDAELVRPASSVNLKLFLGRRVCHTGWSPSMQRWLLHHGGDFNIIHGNGLWMLTGLYLRMAAQRHRIAFVISPHGMLEPEARRNAAWKKLLAQALYERDNLLAAHCFHATSDSEYDAIRHQGLSQAVAVIPHGLDITDFDASELKHLPRQRKVVFLGRLHPHKNISALIRAWRDVAFDFPDWRLDVVGPDPVGYGLTLKNLIADQRLDSSVTIRGAVQGRQKAELLRSASLLVLPSLSENFGLVVLEALACGTPVIATRGTPWAVLSEKRCGWWVASGRKALASALRKAMALPQAELEIMGQKGRCLVRESYSWGSVSEQMMAVYAWLTGRGDRPDCVRFS